MMDIHKASQDKIRALLTDDQKTKYDALQAEMRERRGNHRVVGEDRRLRHRAAAVTQSYTQTEMRKGRRDVYPSAFLRGWPFFRHRCGYNEEQ